MRRGAARLGRVTPRGVAAPLVADALRPRPCGGAGASLGSPCREDLPGPRGGDGAGEPLPEGVGVGAFRDTATNVVRLVETTPLQGGRPGRLAYTGADIRFLLPVP
ncbi:hypothetical protein GCM10010261_56110 [Streptomyces pilosus]|nr:hypothetical protein GCM10010261_56110 [Streptomyces pilosus]